MKGILMPKPIRTDPGDRGMISQATGKPVIPSSSSSGVARRVLPTPSTASTMPSPNTLQTRSAPTIPQDVLIHTSSMSSPMHMRTNRPAKPAGIDIGSMLRKFGNDVIENDLWSNGATLSGGTLPRMDGTYPDDTMQVDLPDLNPAIENVRDHLYGMMTQPSGDQVYSAPLSTGAQPSMSRDAMKSSEPIDMPDFGASMDTLQDYLRGVVGTTNDTDMVPVGSSMSGGMTPMIGSDTIKPSEPKDINLPSLPSIDSVRDFFDDMIAEPVTGDDLVQLPTLANGSTPYASRESVAGGDGKNIFERDQMWDLIGDTDSNQAYIRDAVENGGLSEKDADDIMSRGSFWDQLNKKYSQPFIGMDTSSNGVTLGDVTVMDDGSAYDYNHMTADTMTGTQYMHYAEMGMGGRPIEEIDPTKTYSKRRENVNYGFTPFVPDQTAFWNMVASNVLDFPSRAGSWVANLRDTATPDYTINYGNGNSINGSDFDKLSTPYLNQFYYYDKFDPKRYLAKPKGGNDSTALVREYAIPDVNGETRYAYGDIVDSGYDDTLYLTFSDGATVEVSPDEYTKWSTSDDGMIVPDSYYQAHGNITDSGYDDTFYLTFSDGQRFGVSPDYIKSAADENGNINFETQRVSTDEAHGQLPENLDSLNDMDRIDDNVNEYGGSPLDYAGVIYIPDLVLSDGTSIPYSDVERIYWDKTADNDKGSDDDDISYDFTRFGIGPFSFDNKPRRLNQQEMFKTNGRGGLDVDFSDIGNNAIDWTLGSLPISIGKTMPWIYSTSGATSSLKGVDPSSYDVNSDSSGLIAGSYDDDGNLRYGVMNAKGERDDERSDSTRWWNAAGNAAVPLTEMIAGPVGEQIVPLERIFNSSLPSNPTAWQVIKNALVGAAGEGIEEDIGNIFDELTQYGPRGLFANPVMNKNGEIMRDMYGHEVRDYDTHAEDRMRSFLDPGQLANSFAGGVTVDALMQALPVMSQLAPAVRRDMARRKTGVSQFVEPEER